MEQLRYCPVCGMQTCHDNIFVPPLPLQVPGYAERFQCRKCGRNAMTLELVEIEVNSKRVDDGLEY